jgi:outer membrane protein
MKKIALAVALVLGSATAPAADLVEVYQLAGDNDPVLRAARANRDATRENEPLARSQLLPEIGLSGDVNYLYQDVKDSPNAAGSFSDDFSTQAAAVQVIQPLYRKDRLVQLEQARDQSEQADVDYLGAQQDLILRVADAYFSVLSAQDTLTFAQAEKAAIARQLDQAKQRFEVGLIAITGVHEAQARFDQARADEISASNAVDNAFEALLRITGRPVESLDQLRSEIPLTSPQPATLEAWSDTALQNNPGVLSARINAEIARKQIQFREAGGYPTFDLVGSYGIARSDADFGTDADTASVGVQLRLPLYTGGRVTSGTRQARFEYEAAQERLEERRRVVQNQVRDAYRGVLTSISRVDALAAAQVSAQSALEATEAGFEVGTRTLVDVLNSQRDLFRARRDFAQARYDYILNTLRLMQAAGTLAPEDIEDVNTWLQ